MQFLLLKSITKLDFTSKYAKLQSLFFFKSIIRREVKNA